MAKKKTKTKKTGLATASPKTKGKKGKKAKEERTQVDLVIATRSDVGAGCTLVARAIKDAAETIAHAIFDGSALLAGKLDQLRVQGAALSDASQVVGGEPDEDANETLARVNGASGMETDLEPEEGDEEHDDA